MKNYIYTILAFSLFFLISCANENEIPSFTFEEEDYEFFSVPCDKDTILNTIKGVKINIEKNTFTCTGNSIELKVSAVLDKEDMIRHSMFTISTDGRVLESGGMVYFEVTNRDEVALNQEIKVEVPADYLNDEMTKFVLEKESTESLWRNTEEKINGNNFDVIAQGKKLFKDNCTACHAKDLKSKLTGPALGTVHLRRDKKWLIDFTRNSQKMIGEGDPFALCLWYEWMPTVMNSFEHLSDEELESIYVFIENESIKQGIRQDVVRDTQGCNLDSLNNARRLFNSRNQAASVDVYEKSYYVLFFENLEPAWYNIDRFPLFPDKIAPIIVELKDPSNEPIAISVVHPSRMISFPLVYESKNKYSLPYSRAKKEIPFYLNEKIEIIAAKGNPINAYQKIEYITKKEDNTITLELEPLDGRDFFDLIK